MTSRKHNVALWISVALVAALVAYPLSFGPACWWFSPPPGDGTWLMSMSDVQPHAPRLYWPFGWLVQNGPDSVGRIIQWYGTRRFNVVWLPADPSGDSIVAITDF